MEFRPAIYARYSSEELQRAASIEDQERECLAELEHRGCPGTECFSDSGMSGHVMLARPGYQALLAAVRSGRVNLVVVTEMSRFSRELVEQAQVRRLFRHLRCDLIAIHQGIDTIRAPQAASAMMVLGALQAEAETEAIAHRTFRGLKGAVLRHMHAGGAIYGYRTRAAHEDRPGDPEGTGKIIGYEYLIHEEEAEIICRIFEWYADGNSPYTIAAALNELGIPSPGSRWRNRRKGWCHTGIRVILQNRRYIGELTWNRTTRPRDPERDGKKALRLNDPAEWVTVEAPELRIVPQELWDRAQARQRVRSKAGGGVHAVKTVRPLSGLLRCGACGGALTIRGARTYRCGVRYDRGECICGSRTSVPAHRAEAVVLGFLGKVFCSERMMELTLQKLREQQRAARPPRQDPDMLGRQIAEAEAEAARLVEALGRGVLVEQIEERMRQVEARLRGLRAELQQQRQQETGPITPLPSAVRRLMMNLQRALEAGEAEGLRAVLRQLVERIVVREWPRAGHVRPTISLELMMKGGMAAVLGLNVTSDGAQDWI